MKNIKIIIFGLIVSFLALVPTSVHAKKTKTRNNFTYQKLDNGIHELKAQIFTKKGRVFTYLKNETLSFAIITDSSEIVLGNSSTDIDGYASFFIDKDFPLNYDEEGKIVFVFSFDGNDSCKSSTEELEIYFSTLKCNYFIEDSAKFVSIKLTDKFDEPIADEDIELSIRRLYSYLPIGSETTDENGEITFEFPDNIPGDSIGVIHIRAMLNESGMYGTIIESSDEKWGTAVDFSVKDMGRELFGTAAPLWMVIAIYVILLAAWINFLIALYFLYKMRKSRSSKV